ncbi:Transcriptional regulator [Alteracholeplasma palmae J233]|uniref:Transcriptional regulator n=1 Tax=Alteracholeplasma palmae (strain ATCC 49389 / J233) TaxID=1318466 RepID=U4KNH8_ALTPJ|nr:PadR family transcriptional regulator [Alteracholeplasma palmae]CCV63740.1 Transcriptional regulator [Alteracholeplasma palmae J233]
MISSDNIRGYNDLMILSLLEKEDSYAYLLSKKIKEITNEKYIIKETTLYSAMTRLEKNEFISSYYLDVQTGGSKRSYYKITAAGKEYLKEKKEEWKLVKYVVDKFTLEEE